ncbi:hypothetical protein [Geodermatophilus sp. SYSU D01119]
MPGRRVDAETLARDLAAAVSAGGARGRTLVAIDGPDAAGKTTLADRLAERLPVPALRASVDGFAHPASVRRRRGSLSAEGYYRDSTDTGALTDRLLAPFAGGAATVDAAVRDARTDEPRRMTAAVPADCVLVVDGVFLLRPELCRWWTLALYLHVSEEVTLARALRRDVALFGSTEAVGQRYRTRYLPGQALYRAEARPAGSAHVVVDNDDPAAPVVLRWAPPAADRTPARHPDDVSGH